jgi:peptidoglycan L-alanyl-D-glutamate endopeptidase CwlK
MDPRSEVNLVHVHHDLAAVLRLAAQAPQPFCVIVGIRSPAQQAVALATGHSQTDHSRHLPQSRYTDAGNPLGLSCAVDIWPMTGAGKVFQPADADEVAIFTQINEQIQAAAKERGIDTRWGGQAVGAWVDNVVSHYRDWDHWQLPWSKYP